MARNCSPAGNGETLYACCPVLTQVGGRTGWNNKRRDTLSVREQRLIAARVVLELAVFIAVLFLAVRQNRALLKAIVIPVAALLHHIRCIRDGELERTADRS
ncbi:MAG TPA: hypothetical protein VIM14_07450, partial [Polyangia bacterium]